MFVRAASVVASATTAMSAGLNCAQFTFSGHVVVGIFGLGNRSLPTNRFRFVGKRYPGYCSCYTVASISNRVFG